MGFLVSSGRIRDHSSRECTGFLGWGFEFVKLLVSLEGQEIFTDLGQPPIAPAVGSGEVPEGVWGWNKGSEDVSMGAA